MAGEVFFDYYYGNESNQFPFYTILRQFITGDRFKRLSTDAKLLYLRVLSVVLAAAPLPVDCFYRAIVIYSLLSKEKAGKAEHMNTNIISDIFDLHLHTVPQEIERCAVGTGNYVYIVTCGDVKYIFRCNITDDSYADTVYWLNELSALELPIPKVLFHGQYEYYEYLILTYLQGKDIGLVYQDLTAAEKRKIAKDIIAVQRKVAQLPLKCVDDTWSWVDFIDDMLERAQRRIVCNGYFDSRKVTQVQEQKAYLEAYFRAVKPVAYLDDVTTKNLLVHNGQLSGIVDIDWMGIGDNLTFIALTYVALLNMDYETDYIDYLLEERGCNDMERKAFWFYSLLYCVDFMGERGTQFGDKTVAVNAEIVEKLNHIYENLWRKWCEEIHQ